MPKINLFIFHPFSGFGGADRSIARLINNLSEKQYKIFFICLNKPKIKIFLKKNISIISLNKKKTIFSIFKLKNIIKNKVSKKKKNIFISNQNFANVLSVIFLRKFKNLKIILIERNSLEELKYYDGINNFFKKIIIKTLMKYLYKYSDCVICISKALGNEIRKYCKCKVVDIYNPSLDNKILKNVKKKEMSFKKNIIINVGRLEIQKDHVTLIKAYKLLKNNKKFQLLIVGYGSKFKEIKSLIKKLKLNKSVKVLTKVKNANYLIKKSKLFILSSKYEGFGNVLLEAGMNKIPIISSNCDHGPKEILGYGKYGDLFDVGNYKQLSTKIQNFLNNPQLLRFKSLKFYKSLSRFNTNKIIKKYDLLFKKI